MYTDHTPKSAAGALMQQGKNTTVTEKWRCNGRCIRLTSRFHHMFWDKTTLHSMKNLKYSYLHQIL
jgi:hypothetical protein